MTEDQLFAEVEAFRASGNRGEFEGVEGTPEGTFLWVVTHPEPSGVGTVSPTPIPIFQITFEVTGPDVYVPHSFAVGAAAAPA